MNLHQHIQQEILGPLFEAGAFAKGHAPTENQPGIQARVIARLRAEGGIDALSVQKMGTHPD